MTSKHEHAWRAVVVAIAMCTIAACGRTSAPVLTFAGSVVGTEGEVLATQIARFRTDNPSLRVEVRATPDAADQRHQLYVQWLNAHASEPDVLQLDVVWTPEFAAAGWIAALDRFQPPVQDFFPPTIVAARWQGSTFALPWFVDVGMLYRRTDLVPQPPQNLDELAWQGQRAVEAGIPFGLVWQGARYEGLVTVFLEYLGAFGGRILGDRGEVLVDSAQAQKALDFMRDEIDVRKFVPPAVLTWQEEQTRFAFQNGQAAFMRNWPYAYALLNDQAQSAVAGRFAVSAMPGAPGGAPTAALGGAVLAINAHSDQPDDAYRLMAYLLEPEQMIERATMTGQFPPRPALYRNAALDAALALPASDALAIIEHATPRPATPVYSALSAILQVALHRALTGQENSADALREAATSMRALLARVRLAPALS